MLLDNNNPGRRKINMEKLAAILERVADFFFAYLRELVEIFDTDY